MSTVTRHRWSAWSLFIIGVLLAMTATAGTSEATTSNPFGVMLGSSTGADVQTAQTLGAGHVRKLAFVESESCLGCATFSRNGLPILLTARNTESGSTPSAPPANMADYRTHLGRLLDSTKPQVVVVENEETADNFYSGSAQEYGTQLKAACEVAHARGVTCANGGLPNPTVIAMVYIDYLDKGQSAKADSYAKRATLDYDEYRNLTSSWSRAKVRAVAEEGFAFASTYRSAGADFVNFHWYRADPGAFRETVEMLRSKTGLRVMSNEIGQYNDDPSQTTGIMKQVQELGLAYATWYSLDYTTEQGRQTRALHNPDYSLRPHGQAYKDFRKS